MLSLRNQIILFIYIFLCATTARGELFAAVKSLPRGNESQRYRKVSLTVNNIDWFTPSFRSVFREILKQSQEFGINTRKITFRSDQLIDTPHLYLLLWQKIIYLRSMEIECSGERRKNFTDQCR